MIGEANTSCGSAAGVSLRGLAALLLALLLPLIITACGSQDPVADAPESPPNQRFGYVQAATEIRWDAVPSAENYTIYFGDGDCRLDSGRPVNCEVLASDIAETSYLRHLRDGDWGNYWVVACNRFGCSAINTDNPALPLPPAPDIAGIRRVGSSLEITWRPVPGATHYKVYHNGEIGRCTPATPYPQCEEVAGNVVETTYTHAVPAPKEPSGSSVVARTADSLTLAWFDLQDYFVHHYWIAACNAIGCSAINTDYTPDGFVASSEVLPGYYLIYRQPKGLMEKEFKYVPTGVRANFFKFVDTGLEANTIYYYRIYACNDSGCSDRYMFTEGMTETQGPVDPPTTPTGFRAEEVAKGEAPENAGASWNEVEAATYYEVWRSTDLTRPLTLHETLSAPIMLRCSVQEDDGRACYNDGTLNRNNVGIEFSTTSYKIRACNKAGCSPFTETVTLDWVKQ